MNINELANILNNAYNNAPEDYKVASIHYFGYQYAEVITQNNYSASQIIKLSQLNESYTTEFSKGVKIKNYEKIYGIESQEISIQEYFIKKVDESDYERKSYNQLPECSVQKNGKVNFYYVPLKNGNLKLCLNGVKIPEYKNLNGVEVIPYQNTYPNKYSQRIYFKDCKLSEVKDFLDNILKQLDIIPSNSSMRNLIIK